jgi:hypothetical protein
LANNNLASHLLVYEGDVQRRMYTTYTPDFYLDDATLAEVTSLTRIGLAEMDRVLELSKALPYLSRVDVCPEEFLPDLGKLVGYTWIDSKSTEAQRQELKKIVDVYAIRGTPASVVRVVLSAGATSASIFTPFDKLVFLDSNCRLDDGFYLEDGVYWRWGTYEVRGDISFSLFHSQIADLHPAGTVWYGRESIPSISEGTATANTEAEVDVFHVTYENYAEMRRCDPDILVTGEALATTSSASASQAVAQLDNRPVCAGSVRVVAGLQVLVDKPTNDVEGALVSESGQSIGTTNKITYATGVFNNSSGGDNTLAFPASVASGVAITADYYHNGAIAFWRLGEASDLPYSAGTASDTYGESDYGSASYGKSFVGLIAADTGRDGESIGKYNSSTEVITKARGRQSLFGDYTLSGSPVEKGSATIKVSNQELVDDGLGFLRKRVSSVSESVYQGNGIDYSFSFSTANALIIPETFTISATSTADVTMTLSDDGEGSLVNTAGVVFGSIDYASGNGQAQFLSPLKQGTFSLVTYDYSSDFVSATIDYDSGDINNLTFDTAPGAVPTGLPVFQASLTDISNGTSSIPRPALFYASDKSDITTDINNTVTKWADKTYSDLTSHSGTDLNGSSTVSGKNPVFDPFSRVSESSKLYWLDNFAKNGSTVRGANPTRRDALGKVKEWPIPSYLTFNGANYLTLGSSKALYVGHTVSLVARVNRSDSSRTFIGDYANKSRIWYDGSSSKLKYTANNSGTAVTVEAAFSLKDLYRDKEDNWFILTVSRGTANTPTEANSNGNNTATPTIPNLSTNVAPGSVTLTSTTVGSSTLVDNGAGAFMVKATGASAGGAINYATGVLTSPTWPATFPATATNNIKTTYTTTTANNKVKFYVNGSQVLGTGGAGGETLSSATATFTASYVGGYDGTSNPVRNYLKIANGNGTKRPILDGTTKVTLTSQTIGTVGSSDAAVTGLLDASSLNSPIYQGGDLVPGSFSVSATRLHTGGAAGATITMQDSGNGYMSGGVAAGSAATVKGGVAKATSFSHILTSSIIGSESVGTGANSRNPTISTLTYAPLVPLGLYATATFKAGSQTLFTDVSGNIYSTITAAPTQSTSKLIEIDPSSTAVSLAGASNAAGHLIDGNTYYITVVYKDSDGNTTSIGASRQSQAISAPNNRIVATLATFPSGVASANIYISKNSGKELLVKENLSAGAVNIDDDSVVGKVNITTGDVTDAGGSSGNPYWPSTVATNVPVTVSYRAEDRLNFSDELDATTNVVAGYAYYNQVFSSAAVVPYSLLLYVGPDDGLDSLPTEYIEEADSFSSSRQYGYDISGGATGTLGGDVAGGLVYASGKLSNAAASYSASPIWSTEVLGGSVVKASWVTGGTNFDGLEGALAHVAVYSQPLSDAELSVLTEHLSLKYEIPVNLKAWFSRENLVGPFKSTVTQELVSTEALYLKERSVALAMGANPFTWDNVEKTNDIYEYSALLGPSLPKYVDSFTIKIPSVSPKLLSGANSYVNSRIVPGTLSIYLNIDGGGTVRLFDGDFNDNGPLKELSESGTVSLNRQLYVSNVPSFSLVHAKTPLNGSFNSAPTSNDPNDYLPPLAYSANESPKTYEISQLVDGDLVTISTEKLFQVFGGKSGPSLDTGNVKAWATYELESWIEDGTTLTNATDWKSTSIVPSKVDTYSGSPTYQLYTLSNLISEIDNFNIGDGINKFFNLELSHDEIKLGTLLLSGSAAAIEKPYAPFGLYEEIKPSPLTEAGVISRDFNDIIRGSRKVTRLGNTKSYTDFANIKLDPLPYYPVVPNQNVPALRINSGSRSRVAIYESPSTGLAESDGEVDLVNVGYQVLGGTTAKYYSKAYGTTSIRDTVDFKNAGRSGLITYTYREDLVSYTSSLIDQLSKYSIVVTWVNKVGETLPSEPLVRDAGHVTGSENPLDVGGLAEINFNVPIPPQGAERFKLYVSTNDSFYYEYVDSGEPQKIELLGRGKRTVLGASTTRLEDINIPAGYSIKPATAGSSDASTGYSTDGLAISRSYGNYQGLSNTSGAGVVGKVANRTLVATNGATASTTLPVDDASVFSVDEVICVDMGVSGKEEEVEIQSINTMTNVLTLKVAMLNAHDEDALVIATDGIVQTLYDQGDGTLKGRNVEGTNDILGKINYQTGEITATGGGDLDFGINFDYSSVVYAHRGSGLATAQSAAPYLLPWVATRYQNSAVSGDSNSTGYKILSYEGGFRFSIKGQPNVTGSLAPSVDTTGSTLSIRDGAGSKTGNLYNSTDTAGATSVGTIDHDTGSLSATFNYPPISGLPIKANYKRQEKNYIGQDGQTSVQLQRDGNTAAYPSLQFVSSNSSYAQLDSAMALGSAHTIFIVAEPTMASAGSGTSDQTFIGDDTTQKQSLVYQVGTDYTTDKIKYNYLKGSDNSAQNLTFDAFGNSPRDSFHLYTIKREPTQVTLYLDGVKLQTKTGLLVADTFQWKYAGAYKTSSGEFLDGAIAEILIYDKALAEEDLAKVNNYLLSKFNLANLPVEAFYNDTTERGVKGHNPFSLGTATKLDGEGSCVTIPVTDDIALSNAGNTEACCWEIWVKPETGASGTIWGVVWEDKYTATEQRLHYIKLYIDKLTGEPLLDIRSPYSANGAGPKPVTLSRNKTLYSSGAGGYTLIEKPPKNIADGQWHMLNLILQPASNSAFLYLDGEVYSDNINSYKGVSSGELIGSGSGNTTPTLSPLKGFPVTDVSAFSIVASDANDNPLVGTVNSSGNLGGAFSSGSLNLTTGVFTSPTWSSATKSGTSITANYNYSYKFNSVASATAGQGIPIDGSAQYVLGGLHVPIKVKDTYAPNATANKEVTISGGLTFSPVKKGSIKISANLKPADSGGVSFPAYEGLIIDNKSGVLYGSGDGTINYDTGVLGSNKVTFSDPVLSADSVTVDYEQIISSTISPSFLTCTVDDVVFYRDSASTEIPKDSDIVRHYEFGLGRLAASEGSTSLRLSTSFTESQVLSSQLKIIKDSAFLLGRDELGSEQLLGGQVLTQNITDGLLESTDRLSAATNSSAGSYTNYPTNIGFYVKNPAT